MLGFALFIRVLVFLKLALLFMSRISFITLCILSCKMRIRDKEVDQVKISTGMVIPITIPLHAESDSGRQWIRTGVLAGRIPGPVIRGEGLAGNDAVLKGATGKVGVVFERHVNG